MHALLCIRIGFISLISIVLSSCIDSYIPEAISSKTNYLVVDGFINSNGITTITLSRTYDISAATAPPKEIKATVFIEEENGARNSLRETSQGTYTSNNLVLNPTKRYRLHINTATGKEYTSDFASVKVTPPIDKVAWKAADSGLNIYVDSHDDTNATQYYRWDYEETWEITPPYSVGIEYKNGRIQDITVPYPVICWGIAKSTDIKISSTTRLSQDVVSNFLLRSFPTTASQFNTAYSILVRQHAQTADEYMYWELLKKNTENIGTLFDPLPAQLTGNVHCLNDDTELALGFVGVHSVAEKRIFIRRTELPRTWFVRTGYENCLPPDTVFLFKPAPPPPIAQTLQTYFNTPNYLPIQPYFENGTITGYLAKSRDCIDCRTRGTAVKPSFWP
ncbi:DUF4249 domain-containing protein [Hymenobacter sp. YC55]|uniref:DUF4249 domain-containing protein n=1 Tax=Hymenobacter sp. YC55 TaxID=3034019 RepID=UPI0023F85339|nr:DUF4249 domain-containing protein [Hymenobacter sp. YC55]MDF7814469.1 DUF4249 domain-containing protein [Hymenobacter sp. YC55]